MSAYKIEAVDTSKKHTPLRATMKSGIIEKYPCSTIISGRSGSGKSCLVANLLTRKEFYGDYYHIITIFSPTAGVLDDTYKSLNLHKDNIYNDFDEDVLNTFLEGRKKQIAKKGTKWVVENSRVLFILDDVIANPSFLRSNIALKLFAMLRHYECSVLVLTQSYNKIPRPLRLQANGVYIFPASRSEVNVLLEEITPHNRTKKEFEQVIADATSGKHDFLHINNSAEPGKKIMKNMGDKYY